MSFPCRYNLDSVASFDAVITANHASIVEDLSYERQVAPLESESQEESIQFDGDNASRIEQGLSEGDRASPTLSVVQYRLSMALVAQPHLNNLKEDLTHL